MGRPTKPDPRNKQLNLSLTATELADIEQRARAAGMRPVHFGRALVIAPGVTPVKADNSLIRLVYGQLVRLGSNLNQMVRHLHQTDEPLPADAEPLLRDIRQMIDRLPK